MTSLLTLLYLDAETLKTYDLNSIDVDDFLCGKSIFDTIEGLEIPSDILDSIRDHDIPPRISGEAITFNIITLTVIDYLLHDNYNFVPFLNRLIKSTTKIPSEDDLYKLYKVLIYFDNSKILKSIITRFDHPELLCNTYHNIDANNDLNYLEFAWYCNSYKCFKFLKNLFKNEYMTDYYAFINKLCTVRENDIYIRKPSLNSNLEEFSRFKKWVGRKIYSNFLKNDVLPILKNLVNKKNDNESKWDKVEICSHSIIYISKYAILTYSYGLLDGILDIYLKDYICYYGAEYESKDAYENDIINSIINTIIEEHCPKLWVVLLNKCKICHPPYTFWKSLVEKLLIKYFNMFESNPNIFAKNIDKKYKLKNYWGSPKDRRYSYVVYFDKLFKIIESSDVKNKLLIDTYKSIGIDSDKNIKLDEFLVSLPNNLNFLKKLKINWNAENKPYIINAYRYSDNKTIEWLLRKIMHYNLIFDQCVLQKHGSNLVYNTMISFNPFLAALCNPNINVLKKLLEDYHKKKFEKYPDGLMNWFIDPNLYSIVLFDNKYCNLKHTIKKLELIKDIFRENIVHDTVNSHAILNNYIGFLMYVPNINLKLAKKCLDLIMYILEINDYGQWYCQCIENSHHNCVRMVHNKEINLKYFIMELFLDHPSRFDLTPDQKIRILKHIILDASHAYSSNFICSTTDPNYVRICELLSFEKQKIYVNQPIDQTVVDKYLFSKINMFQPYYVTSYFSRTKSSVIKQNFLDMYNNKSNTNSQCNECLKTEYDCFLEKFHILKEIFQVNLDNYLNIFSKYLNNITNRKIVRYILFKWINIGIHHLSNINMIYINHPLHPDLIAWNSMIFTFHRYFIRKRIIFLKNHRENMFKTIQEIVYRPPIEDAFKSKYPVLANGSRMYQFALANFYLNKEGLDEIEENDDELIYKTYILYKQRDNLQRIKNQN